MTPYFRLRFIATVAATILVTSPSAYAQSSDVKPAEKPATQASEVDTQRRVDEFTDASRLLTGPAGHAECVWLGRRVVGLLWRDDMDTAFRHLDLYDRFSCPGPHIQMAFRCVIRQGNIDPKAPQSLNARVHACWLNPALTPAATSAASPSATATPSSPTGAPTAPK